MKTAHAGTFFRAGLFSALLLAQVSVPAAAQPVKTGAGSKPVGEPAGGALTVRGDIPNPGELKLAELQALGGVNATWTVHGQTRAVVGVPLEKVLRRFGFTPGVMSKTLPPAQKRLGYKLAVVATAPDGFQAVFSAAELTEGMGKTQALVVWMIDGKPLPAEEGSLRLVVPSDGEPSRSLYNLSRLDVVDMRRIVPVAPPAK